MVWEIWVPISTMEWVGYGGLVFVINAVAIGMLGRNPRFVGQGLGVM